MYLHSYLGEEAVGPDLPIAPIATDLVLGPDLTHQYLEMVHLEQGSHPLPPVLNEREESPRLKMRHEESALRGRQLFRHHLRLPHLRPFSRPR